MISRKDIQDTHKHIEKVSEDGGQALT